MIKIRLELWEKAVVMQVLEMDESLRGIGDVFSNGEMSIESIVGPSLSSSDNIIYLWGEKSYRDGDIPVKYFDTHKEALLYYNKVVKLFNDYNNRNKQTVEPEPNIFILE